MLPSWQLVRQSWHHISVSLPVKPFPGRREGRLCTWSKPPSALCSFEAKHRGRPVVVDARDFFYSRISMAIGEDVVLEILDGAGWWMYVNESCARLLERPRDWFPGKNMFVEMPDLAADWKEIL